MAARSHPPPRCRASEAQLESHLDARLFQRTTRSLSATEQGRVFYEGACRVLEALDDAEAGVSEITANPRGALHVSAPLGLGREHRLLRDAESQYRRRSAR